MAQDIIYCDTETFNEEPIGSGSYRYSETVEITLFPYAINDGEVKLWDLTVDEDMPADLKHHLTNPDTIKVWHNSMFDRIMVKQALDIDMPTEEIHDTMVMAAMHGLPMGLDKLCEVFGLSEDMAKIKDGKKLIHLFCKPRPKNMKLRRATRHTHPEEWERFKEYAINDIVSMREIYKKLPKWNMEVEQPLWRLDQRINDRGFNVDVDFAEKAIDAIDLAQKILASRTKQITDGEVQKATQRDALLKYILEEHGVSLPDMTKSTLERRLNDDSLPWAVRELIAIRLDASTSSTSKYRKLVECVGSDGRLRGTLQFCGASRTGRWAGRIFQPQNLPRPTHSEDDIEFAIEAIMNDSLHLLSDDTMKLTSSAIRSTITASEGNKLVVSDLSNIEGRGNAWLAGEDWKLDAFRANDAGTGHDLYALAYARSFGVTPEEVMQNKKTGDGSMRQIGKVQELALGYGGGVGAFVTMAAAYGLDLEDLAAKSLPRVPDHILDSATRFYMASKDKKTKFSTYGLSQDVFVACDSIKRMWREANKAIASYWWELEDDFRYAIANPNEIVESRRLKLSKKGAWVRILLPNGRVLCYPNCQVDAEGNISYMGVNTYTRRWQRIKTYGGKLVENVTQAFSRDVLSDNMQPAEDAGYPIVLTVHDELITETPDSDRFTHEELSRIIATVPSWAEGLPLSAGGFETQRYKKD